MQRKAIRLKRRKQTDWSPQKVAEYSYVLNAMETKEAIFFKSIFSVSVSAIGFLIILSSFKTSKEFSHFLAYVSSLSFVIAIGLILMIWLVRSNYFEMQLNYFKTKVFTKRDALAIGKITFNNFHGFFKGVVTLFFMVGILCAVSFASDLMIDKEMQYQKELRQKMKVLLQKNKELKEKYKEKNQKFKELKRENNASLKELNALDQRSEEKKQEINAIIKKTDALVQKIKELKKELKLE